MSARSLETIDVVIPVYNGEGYIRDSVFSALGQTLKPTQVIVVNDGSTDSTLAILEEIAKTHPSLKVITKPHGERNAARNAGVKASKSTYIGFLDADDIWLPAKLEKQMAVIESESDPQLGLVYCDYIAVDLQNRDLENYGGFQLDPSVKGWVLPALIDGNKICSSASGALVKRACFDTVGLFDEKLSYSEDWEMWMRIAEKFKVSFSPEKLVRIRRRPPGPHDANMDFQFFVGDTKVISKHVLNPEFKILAWKALKHRFQQKPSIKRLLNLFKLSVKDRPLRQVLISIFARLGFSSFVLAHNFENSHFLFRRRHPVLAGQPEIGLSAEPEVTILMPLLNGANYLRSAVDSVFRQTFSNYELIVIDDGSEDSSIEIIRSYGDGRIRLIENKLCLGYAGSLNVGISQAKGKYIARLDADDFWSVNKLEEQVGILRSDPHCVMVTCRTDTVDQGGAVVRPDDWEFSPEAFYFILQFRDWIKSSSVLIRREAVERSGGFSSGDDYSADFALWKRLIELGKIRKIPKSLVGWRQWERGRSSKYERQKEVATLCINQQGYQSLLSRVITLPEAQALITQDQFDKTDPENLIAFSQLYPELCESILSKAPAFYNQRALRKYIAQELTIQKLNLSLYGLKMAPVGLFVGPFARLTGFLHFLYRYAGMRSLTVLLKKEHL